MRPILAGAGAWETLRRERTGRVVAVFRRAIYLELGEELLALVDAAAHPGPLHVLLDEWPPAAHVGAPVGVVAGRLVVDRVALPLSGMRLRRGALPDPASLDLAQAVAALSHVAETSALTEAPWRERAVRALDQFEEGDLASAAALLAGLGPGLTPAGDDALAGILFGVRAVLGAPVEASLRAVVGALPTTPLSLALIRWAARGQALAPAHALLETAARRDSAGTRRHARALAAVGHTSGADFAFGLSAGLRVAGADQSVCGSGNILPKLHTLGLQTSTAARATTSGSSRTSSIAPAATSRTSHS